MRKCDNCKTLYSKYSVSGTYVAGASCPAGTSMIDTTRNGCERCLSQSKYWNVEVAYSCTTTCPTYLVPNAITGKCNNCKTLSLGY